MTQEEFYDDDDDEEVIDPELAEYMEEDIEAGEYDDSDFGDDYDDCYDGYGDPCD